MGKKHALYIKRIKKELNLIGTLSDAGVEEYTKRALQRKKELDEEAAANKGHETTEEEDEEIGDKKFGSWSTIHPAAAGANSQV